MSQRNHSKRNSTEPSHGRVDNKPAWLKNKNANDGKHKDRSNLLGTRPGEKDVK